MIPRSAWGAHPPDLTRIATRAPASITVAHVHYSDGPPPTPPDETAAVRGIQQFHMGPARRWADIGYHRLIGPTGTVYEGRPLDHVGAETQDHNANSAGYCFLTNGPVTGAAWGAFLAQLAADEHTIGHPLEVRPHSADYPTACPGDTLRRLIPTAHQPTSPPAAPQGPAQPPQPPGPEEDIMPPVLTATDPTTGDYWAYTPATGALDAYNVGGARNDRYYGNFHDHPEWVPPGPIVAIDYWPGAGHGAGYALYALDPAGNLHPFHFDPTTSKTPAS